jgi:hypothetical protein
MDRKSQLKNYFFILFTVSFILMVTISSAQNKIEKDKLIDLDKSVDKLGKTDKEIIQEAKKLDINKYPDYVKILKDGKELIRKEKELTFENKIKIKSEQKILMISEKEWGYEFAGSEYISFDGGLVNFGNHICDKLDKVTINNGKLNEKTTYNNCIEYPVQSMNKLEYDELEKKNNIIQVDKKNITKINDTTFKIDFDDDYDPLTGNYTIGLLSCYSFDSDFTDDYSTHDLTDSGGASINTTFKKIGSGASYYDGVDAQAEATDYSLAVDSDFTISLWINAEVIVSDDAPFSTQNGNIMVSYLSDKYKATTSGFADNTITTSTALTTDTWNHVVFVFNRTLNVVTKKMYIDGVLDNTEITSGNLSTTQTHFDFGEKRYGSGDFQGFVDEAMIWNTGLSASQVLELNASATCAEVIASGVQNTAPTLTDFFPLNISTYTNGTTSILLSLFYNDSESESGTISFVDSSDNSILCTNTSVSAGTTLYCLFDGLTDDNTYTWYANATDGTDITTSDVYNLVVNASPSEGYAYLNTDADLLLWLQMEQDETDSSPNSYDGSEVGTMVYSNTAGITGAGYFGDFDNGGIDRASDMDIGTSDFTISFWGKNSNGAGTWYLFYHAWGGDAERVLSRQEVSNTDLNNFAYDGTNTDYFKITTDDYNDGAWYYYVMKRNDTGFYFTIYDSDCAFVEESGNTDHPTMDVTGSNNKNFKVGYDGSTTYSNYYIDEFRAYTRELTSDEVDAVCSLDLAGADANNAPTVPTTITHEDVTGDASYSLDTMITINASGSTDADSDNLTYFVEIDGNFSYTESPNGFGDEMPIQTNQSIGLWTFDKIDADGRYIISVRNESASDGYPYYYMLAENPLDWNNWTHGGGFWNGQDSAPNDLPKVWTMFNLNNGSFYALYVNFTGTYWNGVQILEWDNATKQFNVGESYSPDGTNNPIVNTGRNVRSNINKDMYYTSALPYPTPSSLGYSTFQFVNFTELGTYTTANITAGDVYAEPDVINFYYNESSGEDYYYAIISERNSDNQFGSYSWDSGKTWGSLIDTDTDYEGMNGMINISDNDYMQCNRHVLSGTLQCAFAWNVTDDMTFTWTDKTTLSDYVGNSGSHVNYFNYNSTHIYVSYYTHYTDFEVDYKLFKYRDTAWTPIGSHEENETFEFNATSTYLGDRHLRSRSYDGTDYSSYYYSSDTLIVASAQVAPTATNPIPSNESTLEYITSTDLQITYTDGNSEAGTVIFSMDDTEYCTNTSITSGANTLCNVAVSVGLHTWNVSVTDGIDTTYSGLYTFTVNESIPTITLVEVIPLNSSRLRVPSWNSTYLAEIEYMLLNYSITSNITIDDWYLEFTANGSDACALGNKQSNACFSWVKNSWVEYRNNTNTSSYDGTDTGGNQGDRINTSIIGSGTDFNLLIQIDEHYNPNIYKNYGALYDFSDVKWQSGNDQRITKKNHMYLSGSPLAIPLDADQYKIDFRVQAINNPTQPLEACLCNSSYYTGDARIVPECVLIASINNEDFQDDGTKFRGIFTKQLIDQIGDIKSVVLMTDEPNPNRYYAIKTYKAQAGGYLTHWNYSTDSGTTFQNLGDGYESEININWFFNGGINTTGFVHNLTINTTSGISNSLVSQNTWDIIANANYAPLLLIKEPNVGANITQNISVNFSVVDPNDDNVNMSVYLYNSDVEIERLATDMNQSNTSILYETLNLGTYNLTMVACELDTNELYCTNDTHVVTISQYNYEPTVNLIEPLVGSSIIQNLSINFTSDDYNNHSLNASLYLFSNGTEIERLVTDMNQSNTTFIGTTSNAGLFNLTLIACELDTTELYCVNDTHQITINASEVVECTEDWSCGAWSDVGDSCGTRTCTDANACGTTVSKPSESETCPDDGGGSGSSGGGSTGSDYEDPDDPTPDIIDETETNFVVMTNLDKFSYSIQEPILIQMESYLSVLDDTLSTTDAIPIPIPSVRIEIFDVNMEKSYGVYGMKLNGVNLYEARIDNILEEGKYTVKYIINTGDGNLIKTEDFIVTQSKIITNIIRRPVKEADLKYWYVGGAVTLFLLLSILIFVVNKQYRGKKNET